jgi:hypothetical protein
MVGIFIGFLVGVVVTFWVMYFLEKKGYITVNDSDGKVELANWKYKENNK